MKMDTHTAAAVLDDELYELAQELRKARFVMDQVWEDYIADEALPKASRETLIVSMAINNTRLEIINDYLISASHLMKELRDMAKNPTE